MGSAAAQLGKDPDRGNEGKGAGIFLLPPFVIHFFVY